LTTADDCPGKGAVTIEFGQTIRGAVSSTTMTVNEQFGPPGIVQVTILAPTAKNDPEAGVQVAGPQPPATSGGG